MFFTILLPLLTFTVLLFVTNQLFNYLYFLRVPFRSVNFSHSIPLISNSNVIVADTGTSDALMWTLSGSQGSKWIQGKVGISTTLSFSVVLEGIRGKGITGDIAIDDISFSTTSFCSRKSRNQNIY